MLNKVPENSILRFKKMKIRTVKPKFWIPKTVTQNRNFYPIILKVYFKNITILKRIRVLYRFILDFFFLFSVMYPLDYVYSEYIFTVDWVSGILRLH